MPSALLRTILSLTVLFGGLDALFAQEFRVYTRVFDESGFGARNDTRPRVIGRSVSLFHAGKVYDYVDGVGEVTIFEPAQRRFTIIAGSGKTAAVVTFDELNHLLELAETEAEREAAQLAERGGKEASVIGAFLLFLINPQFEQRIDNAANRILLSSRYYNYTVRYDAKVRPEYVDSYLRYADWAARLNSVLHPQALLPAPRLKLNQMLRERRLMPVEVILHVKAGERFQLRAEHTIRWALDSKDRSNINHWESLLRDRSLRFVTFPEYQRTVMLTQQSSR
ncbi:MAG TPA: hypothetical protein EYP14_17965 [Planctomycetaceae bacterium]|nr:hypothetical protein [Planctomycetaceae bacterium]